MAAEPVLYLEPEIEQDEGHDVTVRAFTADMKSCISFTVRDTNVLVIRTSSEGASPKCGVRDRLTHSAFVRLDRKGWLEPTTLLSLRDLDQHNDLKLLDHESTPLDASVVSGLLLMAHAAYHEATMLDRALKTLQSIADTGNEVAQKFLDRNKEAIGDR